MTEVKKVLITRTHNHVLSHNHLSTKDSLPDRNTPTNESEVTYRPRTTHRDSRDPLGEEYIPSKLKLEENSIPSLVREI